MVFFHWVAGKRDPPPSAIYWRRHRGTPKMAPPRRCGRGWRCGWGSGVSCPGGPRMPQPHPSSLFPCAQGRPRPSRQRTCCCWQGWGRARCRLRAELQEGRQRLERFSLLPRRLQALHPSCIQPCLFHRLCGSAGWRKILKLRTDTSGCEEVWSFKISRCESGLSQLAHVFKQCMPGQPGCHLCNCVVPNIFFSCVPNEFQHGLGYAAPVGHSFFQRRWSCSLCLQCCFCGLVKAPRAKC